MKVNYSLTKVAGYVDMVLMRKFISTDGREVRGVSVVKPDLAERYLGRAVMAGAVITHEINQLDQEIWSWVSDVVEL